MDSPEEPCCIFFFIQGNTGVLKIGYFIQGLIPLSKKPLDEAKSFFAFAAAEQVEGPGGGYSIQPGGELGFSLESVDRPVHLDKYFLRHILSIFLILYNTDGCVVHSVLVSIHKVFKRRFIPAPKSLYQLSFSQRLMVNF